MTVPLIAYTDRWSVRAGGRIAVKVSCASANYQADLVRIRSADPNPAGPGQVFEDVPSGFAGRYPGRAQTIHSGSHGTVPLESWRCRRNGPSAFGCSPGCWIGPKRC